MPAGARWLTGPFVESGMLWARLRYGLDLDRASALAAVRQTRIPVLLIHGLTDEKTSPENSRGLEAANPGDAQLWLVPDGGHTGAWHTAGRQFETRVVQWFDEH